MTTEPNGVVQPIHEQDMPVILMTAEEVDRWLKGGSVDDAVVMQRPASDDALDVGLPVKLGEESSLTRLPGPHAQNGLLVAEAVHYKLTSENGRGTCSPFSCLVETT